MKQRREHVSLKPALKLLKSRNFPFAAAFLDFFIARLLPKLVAGV
jgi:hypothetical protein